VIWVNAEGCALQFSEPLSEKMLKDPRWNEANAAKRAA
jgi:hypothetical protein